MTTEKDEWRTWAIEQAHLLGYSLAFVFTDDELRELIAELLHNTYRAYLDD